VKDVTYILIGPAVL